MNCKNEEIKRLIRVRASMETKKQSLKNSDPILSFQYETIIININNTIKIIEDRLQK